MAMRKLFSMVISLICVFCINIVVHPNRHHAAPIYSKSAKSVWQKIGAAGVAE